MLDSREECWQKASEFIRMVSGETEELHQLRMDTDPFYKPAINHVFQLYWLIQSNRHFQEEERVRLLRLQQLLFSNKDSLRKGEFLQWEEKQKEK